MKFGLKLWSTNKESIPSAAELYKKGVYDYIELYVNPVSPDTDALEWQKLMVPVHLHAPHSYSGLNLSQSDRESENRKLIQKVEHFQKQLKPSYIIFHPGMEGSPEETLRQFKMFKSEFPGIFKVAVVENKPKVGMKDENCLGASPEEMKHILASTGLGFCLDVGHAICYAAWAKLPWEKVVEQFNALNPRAYHLSDGDVSSVKDMHEHFGAGNFDLKKIMTMIPREALLAVETRRDSWKDLTDFENDVKYLKRYL